MIDCRKGWADHDDRCGRFGHAQRAKNAGLRENASIEGKKNSAPRCGYAKSRYARRNFGRRVEAGVLRDRLYERRRNNPKASQIVIVQSGIGATIERTDRKRLAVDAMDCSAVGAAFTGWANIPLVGWRLFDQDAASKKPLEFPAVIRFRLPPP